MAVAVAAILQKKRDLAQILEHIVPNYSYRVAKNTYLGLVTSKNVSILILSLELET